MRISRTELPSEHRNDFATMKTLLPYLSQHRWRIGLALLFLILAKFANIGVPLALKSIVDSLDASTVQAGIVVIPIALLVGYGLLRLSTSVFQELRNAVFAKAAQQSTREIGLKVFEHLHALSLRFHLDRQTGGVSRDMERGSRSITQLLNYLVFSILPTMFEIIVVCAILFTRFDIWFSVVTLVTVVIYFLYTWKVTEWRLKFRIEMNQADSIANTTAIDSLINYETVKYFGNERLEADKYNRNLKVWEKASVKSQVSLALLNTGQGFIIGIGLTILLIMAARQVVDGVMTLGDFVMVNAFMIQIYLPLNFLGSVFREIKHCLTDMDRMFSLMDVDPEVKEADDAKPLQSGDGDIRFEHVDFNYDANRDILHDIDFIIPAGKKVAVVGPSGAGKSTLARLLFRFYDTTRGHITIGGTDIRDVTIDSLRATIGIVPQDTVLFNDSLLANIGYGRPDASIEEINAAVRLAHLESFVGNLPAGLETLVGERGLKLSGGEKQRVAIARTLLKNPPILILDEATSSLDSGSERSIQHALNEISMDRTTLVIAHRLSTVVDSDQIIVIEHGRIVERGTHDQLLTLDGEYAKLWRLQQQRDAVVRVEQDLGEPLVQP
ncbi:MAG: metal ABC transporter permease [marine bacterium B5-7]|nr:MAG: metal ABC transporter permease [marine bacterium B5-7]